MRRAFFLFCFCVIYQSSFVCDIYSQTPAPATARFFQLPLADGTETSAVILPYKDGTGWLIYSTTTGKLGVYVISPGDDVLPPTPPIPPPPDPPNPPTPPPTPTARLRLAIVEDSFATSIEHRQLFTDSQIRTELATGFDFCGFIPHDAIDKQTGKVNPSLKPFIDRAMLHTLPWMMFVNPSGQVIYEANPPLTKPELLTLLSKYRTEKNALRHK